MYVDSKDFFDGIVTLIRSRPTLSSAWLWAWAGDRRKFGRSGRIRLVASPRRVIYLGMSVCVKKIRGEYVETEPAGLPLLDAFFVMQSRHTRRM